MPPSLISNAAAHLDSPHLTSKQLRHIKTNVVDAVVLRRVTECLPVITL